MLQMKNQSRFAPAIHLLPDAQGVDTVFVVARGTFALAQPAAFLPAQPPPNAGDEYWGAPGASSLRYASDAHVGKVGTDVALVGSAHAPRGRPVDEMRVALAVAGRMKVVRVIGDRAWRRSADGFTPPRPFAIMPLVYERAFGGPAPQAATGAGGTGGLAGAGGELLADERNPVGRAFRGRRSARDVGGEALPNLEDPRWPLRRLGDCPPPAGFGYVAPAWLPRRRHAGTYDAAWKRDRAPLLPGDYDRRFSNAAAADLIFDPPLRGGEAIELDGFVPDGSLRLALPVVRPRVEICVAGGWQRPAVELETVLLEPDAGRLSLGWRASLRCDKRALRVQEIRISEDGGACPARFS